MRHLKQALHLHNAKNIIVNIKIILFKQGMPTTFAEVED